LDSGSGYENAVTSRVVSKNEENCVTSSDIISFARGTLILVLSLLKSSASGSETRQVLVRAQQEPSYNMAWYSTAWYGTAWYSTAWYRTACTVQHVQYNDYLLKGMCYKAEHSQMLMFC
jgi:hypothetical protein